jgi:hypothetical protein
MRPDEEGSWWDRAVDSVESTVSDLAHDAAEAVSDVPVLGTVAEVGADMVEGIAQFDSGLLKGAGTLVGGIVNMAEHPVDTVMGLESMTEHIPIVGTPLKAVHEVYDIAVNDKDIGDAISDLNPVNDLNYWEKVGSAVIKPYEQEIEEGKYMEAFGRGVFDIGSILLTGGEAVAVEGAADAGRVAEVARVAEGAEVASDAARATEGALEGVRDPLAGLSESEIDAAVNGEAKSNVMVEAPAENLKSKTKPYGDGQYTDFTFDAKTSVPDAQGNVRTTMKIHDADPTAPLGSNSREGPTIGIEQGKGNRRVVPDPDSDWGGKWINKGSATSDEWNDSHIPIDRQ